MSDRLLRLALRSYPRERRERDGAVLLDCAAELASAGGSSRIREAAGLVAGGVAARAGTARADLASAPWRRTLEALAVPLAAATLAVWAAGAKPVLAVPGPAGRWWSAILVAAAVALIGTLARRRGLALAGWAGTLACFGHSLVMNQAAAQPARFPGSLGSFGLDVGATFLPLMLLGAAAAIAVRGPARPGDLAWLALPVVAVALSDPAPWLVLGLIAAPFVVAAAANADPVRRLSTALLGAVAAPEAVWLSTGVMPYPGPVAALVVLAAGAALAGAAVLALAVRAGRG